jgi:hypothetical protein
LAFEDRDGRWSPEKRAASGGSVAKATCCLREEQSSSSGGAGSVPTRNASQLELMPDYVVNPPSSSESVRLVTLLQQLFDLMNAELTCCFGIFGGASKAKPRLPRLRCWPLSIFVPPVPPAVSAGCGPPFMHCGFVLSPPSLGSLRRQTAALFNPGKLK